jgi:SAM-dependent methyltransferase
MSEQKQTEFFKKVEGDNWFQRNSSNKSLNPHLEVIAKHLKPKSKILEIGCSDGRNLNYLTEITGSIGFGIDPSEKAISVGKKSFPKLNLAIGTADTLPFSNLEFDLVYFGFCLYLVDRSFLPKVVSESDRVLRDKGFLAITDFSGSFKSRTPYSHAPGLFSYRTNYPALWTQFHYSLVEHVPFSHNSSEFDPIDRERIAHTVLFKDIIGSYPDLGVQNG